MANIHDIERKIYDIHDRISKDTLKHTMKELLKENLVFEISTRYIDYDNVKCLEVIFDGEVVDEVRL